MLSFGPVPSRRLGHSLGVNNIEPKTCSYSCIYCQVGPTTDRALDRRSFYDPERIRAEVEGHIAKVRARGHAIDYLSFVPDGEPTLDNDLARTIDLLRATGIKIAVITNSSLLWKRDVRNALKKADWVSVKVDTVDENSWHILNRPHLDLRLPAVLAGIVAFAAEYSGFLAAETMLVDGINTDVRQAEQLAEFLARISPDTSYLSVPTHPPAFRGVNGPDEQTLNDFFQIFDAALKHVELLTGHEGNAFASTGNIADDLLSITAVHPMREDAVREMLDRANSDWSVVRQLLAAGELRKTEHLGREFYLRRFISNRGSKAMTEGLWPPLFASLAAATVTSAGIYTIQRYEDWGRRNIPYFMCFAAGCPDISLAAAHHSQIIVNEPRGASLSPCRIPGTAFVQPVCHSIRLRTRPGQDGVWDRDYPHGWYWIPFVH